MAAPCLRVVGSFLGKCVNCCSNLNPTALQFSRQICVSSALSKKEAAPEPEKYTEEFLKKQIEEFEIGKRHLANMMGEDPENFTQEDIDKGIAYLFPSGLFNKNAHPIMKHPDEIFPKQRAMRWGEEDKRPFHFLFYTGKQSYYSLMHIAYGKMLAIEKHQDHLRANKVFSADAQMITLGTSRWLTKVEMEALLLENITTHNYDHFIKLMTRLCSMPYCGLEEQFVMQYRRQLEDQSTKKIMPPLQKDDKGVAFSTAEGQRKTSRSSVVLRDCGSGRVIINGQDYLQYFIVLQDREQLMFPLQFVNMLGRFDLECTVSGGGRSSQAGALRLAIARALLSFVPERMAEDMRQAGLLTADPRKRERKKPGQEGARSKFTWNKR